MLRFVILNHLRQSPTLWFKSLVMVHNRT